MSTRFFVSAGAAFAGLGVVLGAFGAHVLKERLSTDDLQIFTTGTNYQLIHGVALLLVASLGERIVSNQRAAVIGWLFIAGIVLFSGSLYALAMTGTKSFGMVAPIGGLSLIVGWLVLTISALPSNQSPL